MFQDKFINYQIDAPDVNPKVIDVKINSVAVSNHTNIVENLV